VIGCSKTGSRMEEAWSHAAAHRILVSGINKIVAHALMMRFSGAWSYALVFEDQRARRVYGSLA